MHCDQSWPMSEKSNAWQETSHRNPLQQLGGNFMAYPIKYIENNLVWNKDGECYAYYELVPYNYSFLESRNRKYKCMILSDSLSHKIVMA